MAGEANIETSALHVSALPATAVVESMLLWSNLRYTTVDEYK